MKAFIVLMRHGNIIERHVVAALNTDAAANVAINRFGGTVINVILA